MDSAGHAHGARTGHIYPERSTFEDLRGRRMAVVSDSCTYLDTSNPASSLVAWMGALLASVSEHAVIHHEIAITKLRASFYKDPNNEPNPAIR